MKNYLLLIVLLVSITQKMNAQMAVSDAGVTAAANQTKITSSQTLIKTTAMLGKTTAMLDQITNMRKKYDSMMENIEVVSDAIATGKQIVNITQTLSQINTSYQKAVNYINNENLIHPIEKAKFIYAFTKVVGQSIDEMDDAYSLSTSGTYKMSDAERMTLLKDIQKQLNDQNSFIVYFLQKIQRGVTAVKKQKREKSFIENANNSFKNN